MINDNGRILGSAALIMSQWLLYIGAYWQCLDRVNHAR